jgi:hypothetical protein
MPDESVIRFTSDTNPIEIQKIKTRNGSRIEIMAIESGKSIKLDPIELESLTWQDEADLARMLQNSADSE